MSTAARRCFGRVAGAGVTVLSGVVTLPAAYLGVLTIAGVRRPRPDLPDDSLPAAHIRFAILVPAHDEAAGIGPTLDSLSALDYPTDMYSVHVVADNCADDTASVVIRHGWEAHERTDPVEPGKGPALNWLHDRLVERGVAFDAAVIVDADTTLDTGFLTAMDRAVRSGAIAAQGYYSVRDPEASPSASFRFAALACRHHLRPLGRNRLGASCGLFGNGMVFHRDVLAERRWSGHLVEDAEFQMELLLDGHLVTYVPDAVLWAEMPHALEQAATQNQRWERGRIDLARRFVPPLLGRLRTDRGRRVAVGDAVLDHSVPPLSVLVALQTLVAAIAAGGAMVGLRAARRALVVDLLGLGVVIAHVVAGLRSVGASSIHYRSLAAAPSIVLWKVKLWASVLGTDREVEWTRTRRNVEAVDSSNAGGAT